MLPAAQAALEEFDLSEMQCLGALGDKLRRRIAWAGAVDDDFTIAWNQLGVIFNLFGRDAPRAGDDLRIGEQIERLADIEKQDFYLCIGRAYAGLPA